MAKPKFLLTGFKPFRGISWNPSEVLLKEFERSEHSDSFSFQVLSLPVMWEEAFLRIKSQLDQEEFDHILMFGRGKDKIILEAEASNFCSMETSYDDDGKAIPNSVENLKNQIFLDEPVQKKKRFYYPREKILDSTKKSVQDLKLTILCPEEWSPGNSYICNELSYRVLRELEKNEKKIQTVGFIHLPSEDQKKVWDDGRKKLWVEWLRNCLFAYGLRA